MTETDGLPTPQRHWVMACALGGFALTNLDSAIANIALPTLSHEFNASASATIWVVNIYQLAMACCLLPAAALGGMFGIKRVYAFGLILFTLASVGCAFAPTLPALVGARLIQGIGGACVSGLGPALVRVVFPRSKVGQGLGLVALVIALSGVLGPTIAAAILSVATWPWLFLVNVPVCLIAAPIFMAMAPATPGNGKGFDYPGAFLSAIALGLIVIGVGELGGEGRNAALGAIGVGIAFFVWLIAHQNRRETPLLPLDLVRIPLFALSMATSSCSYCAQILAYISLPFLFQVEMHHTAMMTGLLVTPWPIAVAVAAPIAGRLIGRYPAAILGSVGLAVMTVGLALLATMGKAPADWDIAWRMAICGVGFGFFQTPNNTTLMTAGPVSRSAAASAMLAIARLLGWSFGSALVALLFAVQGGAATVTCLIAAAVVSGLGAVISASRGLVGKPAAAAV